MPIKRRTPAQIAGREFVRLTERIGELDARVSEAKFNTAAYLVGSTLSAAPLLVETDRGFEYLLCAAGVGSAALAGAGVGRIWRSVRHRHEAQAQLRDLQQSEGFQALEQSIETLYLSHGLPRPALPRAKQASTPMRDTFGSLSMIFAGTALLVNAFYVPARLSGMDLNRHYTDYPAVVAGMEQRVACDPVAVAKYYDRKIGNEGFRDEFVYAACNVSETELVSLIGALQVKERAAVSDTDAFLAQHGAANAFEYLTDHCTDSFEACYLRAAKTVLSQIEPGYTYKYPGASVPSLALADIAGHAGEHHIARDLIKLNPHEVDFASLYGVEAHELMHAAGMDDESVAELMSYDLMANTSNRGIVLARERLVGDLIGSLVSYAQTRYWMNRELGLDNSALEGMFSQPPLFPGKNQLKYQAIPGTLLLYHHSSGTTNRPEGDISALMAELRFEALGPRPPP